MADPQPLEVYQYNLKAFYFIRIFKSLYVWELGDKKGMEHLNFWRLSKIYDIILFLLIIERRWFERTNKALCFLLTLLVIFQWI